MKTNSFSKDRSFQTQVRNINEDFTDSLNLPDEASVHATLTKKSPRVFETKVEISLWHESIFCSAIAHNPFSSLNMARRKIIRLVSDLHDRKFVTRKHAKPKIAKLATEEAGAF